MERAYRLLALLPGLAILVGVPLANRVRPYVLGLPFLLFWIVCCVLLTSAVMTLVWYLDRAADAAKGPGRAGGGPGGRGEAP
ncbi:MAG: DUF3311 domain-containing protein [Candidatus Eisenbacteria bacterium]|nr:DUF3311 domain-containing protein [Candidatus Eisenbacteria bacterium]